MDSPKLPRGNRKASLPEMTRSERRKSLATIIAMVSIVGAVFGLTLPLLNLLLERQGVAGSAIGLNTAMGALGVLCVTPLVPRAIRFAGTRRFILASLATSALLLLAIKWTGSYMAWIPLRFLLGGTTAGLFVVSETWINQLADDRSRGRLMGTYAACLSAGFAAGPILIQFLGIDGWRPFLAGAGLFAVAGGVILLTAKGAPEFEDGKAGGILHFFRLVPIAILAGLLYGAVETGAFGLLPPYAVRAGLAETSAAALLSAVAAGNILFQYPVGWLADKTSPIGVMVMCAVFGVIGSLSLPSILGTMAAWPVLLVWGGTITGLYTISLMILGQRFRGGELASANAALITAYGFGAFAAPVFIGGAMDLYDPHGFAVAIAAIFGVFLVSCMVSRRARSDAA